MAEEKFDIAHLAKLARLRFNEKETEMYRKNMEEIVHMVENLPDFPDAKLTLDPNDAMDLRPDVPAPSLSREEVLRNAPKTEAGCVVVPRVVDEG